MPNLQLTFIVPAFLLLLASAPTPGFAKESPASERELGNLSVFARVYGYVRFF